MASNESPTNTFLSLRSRLRTPECSSSQQFSGRVAKAARLDSPKVQEHLFSEFRKILATYSTHAIPEQIKETNSTNENYTLLEQFASEEPLLMLSSKEQTAKLTTDCHPGCLAITGSNLHHQSISEIDRVHEAVHEKIRQLSRDSNRVLAQKTSLYETIAQPLSELPCPSRDAQAETISDHLSLLNEEFANADDRIQALYEKWQACVSTEQDAWQRLTSDGDEPRAELELQNLVDAIDEVTTSAETEMKNIEAEYGEYIQIESLKVMQTLMEG